MPELTYVEAAHQALAEEMARDETIFVVGEGIGPRGGNFNTTTGLFDLYGPERLRDTPICERGFVGLCAGAAMTGTRPVVDFMFLDFILDAFGELINQIAKMQYMSSGRLKMPIVLRGCIGVGGAAATHHSGNYYPIFTHLPGFKVAVPSSPYDAKGLAQDGSARRRSSALSSNTSPCSTLGVKCQKRSTAIPFGQAAVCRRGEHLTVVAFTTMVPETLQVAEALSGEGISVEVIDPRTTSPLDIDTVLESVHRTGRLLIADETFAPCGMGAEIAAAVVDRAFDDLDAPVRRLNGEHVPTPYSAPLEAAIAPNREDIERAICDLMAE